MYWNTKEHQKYLGNSKISRIRAGTTIPPGAVNLAYAHAPLPSVDKNIRIVDINEPGTGNTDRAAPMLMWPDQTGLLRSAASTADIPGRKVMITNMFKNQAPLFYKHRLEYCILSQSSPDNQGLYQGHSIKLVNQYGLPINTNFLVGITPVKGRRHAYYADIYLETEDKLYVIYDAVDIREDGSRATYNGHKELCKQVPIFEETYNIDNILRANSFTQLFYRAPGEHFGTSRVYTPTWIIEDTREPEQFHYSIRVEIEIGEESYLFYTPSYYADVLNKYSLLSDELTDYVNGDKRITAKIAKDIIDPFIPNNLKNLQEAVYTYSVVCDNAEVKVKTRSDGVGPVWAKTTQDTGTVGIAGDYNVFYKDKEQVFSYIIELIRNGEIYKQNVATARIRKSTGQLRLTNFIGLFGQLRLTKEELAECFLRVKLIQAADGSIPMVDMFVSDMDGNLLFGDKGELIFPYSAVDRQAALYAISQANYHYYSPTYAVRTEDSQRIRLLPPLEDGPFESWYLRVQNGMFTKTIIDDQGGEDTYVYFLPEYERQPYSGIGPPFVKFINEQPTIESKYTVRVRRTPMLVSNKAPVVVRINGNPIGVVDIDAKRGIIELRSIITETDHVEVSYFYKENCVTYKGYIDNEQNYWLLDLNPGYGHKYNYVNGNGSYRQDDTFRLLNKTIYVYLKPAGRLDTNGNLIPESFNANCLMHTFEPVSIPNAIMIGMVHVRPHITSKGLQVIDTRTRGGGVKPELLDRALEIEPASEYYWDIGRLDGQPYMESGVGILRLPKRMLKEYGGKFTKEEIEATINKYIAWGTLPIIEYVDRTEFILTRPDHATINRIFEGYPGAYRPTHPTVIDPERLLSDLVVLHKPGHLMLETIRLGVSIDTPKHPTAKNMKGVK